VASVQFDVSVVIIVFFVVFFVVFVMIGRLSGVVGGLACTPGWEGFPSLLDVLVAVCWGGGGN
jgi:hypothetical protein